MSLNTSAPLLPPGLNFSSQLGPVIDRWSNLTGVPVSCPYLYSTAHSDEPQNLLDWYIDPAYYLYHGCRCSVVSSKYHHAQRNMTDGMPDT